MIKREWNEDPKTFFDYLQKLIELEEAEELEEFRKSFLELTPEQRQKMGKALLRLRLEEAHYSPGGHRLVTFRYADGRPLPIYSPDTGDLVSLSDETHEFSDTLIGTIYDKDRKAVTVALREDLPDWLHEEGLYHLNIAGSRSTYKKIYEALRKVREAKDDRLAFFRDLSLGLRKPESYDPIDPETLVFFNPSLNRWQKEAVAKALGAKDIAVIHGPPGTGKTTVLAEVIQQIACEKKSIFATAPSNTACDQLVESLVRTGVPVVRLGHPARIMNHLREYTLDFQLANHPLAETVDQLEHQLEGFFKKKTRARKYSFSNEQREEIDWIKHEIRELDHQIFAQVIDQAAVIVGTHASANEPFLKKKSFDLLVMDEASQAIEPMAWIPLIKAKKVIFSGDHLQLPPTVKSKKADEMGLSKTLFERIHSLLGEEWKHLLRVQYRMNEKIMNFSSREFYQGRLIADEKVKSQRLSMLPEVRSVPATEEVFLFLDTSGKGFEERREEGSESRYNPEEAELIVKKLQEILVAGVRPEHIAIISPYSAQVRLLNSMISENKIEIDSVDGFQGREKEVILLSLVRSNFEGEMGFLADTRRMNVAMTRAKRKLLIVGDSGTLSHMKFYEDLIQYAEEIKGYRSLWEEVDIE